MAIELFEHAQCLKHIQYRHVLGEGLTGEGQLVLKAYSIIDANNAP